MDNLSQSDSPKSSKELGQSIELENSSSSKQDGHRHGHRPATTVEISFKIIYISGVDSVSQSFLCDFIIMSSWIDKRTIGKENEELDWSKLFNPKISIQNALELNSVYNNKRLLDSETGSIQETARYQGTLYQHLDLNRFPFDFQDLKIAVRSGQPVTNMRLEDHSTRTNTMDNFLIPDWTVHHFSSVLEDTDVSTSGSAKSYSMMNISVRIQRKFGYYIWNIALVNFLIVTSSWVSFAMEEADLGDKMQVNITLLLTAVALKFVVASSLPKVSYLTVLDKYIVVSFLYLALVILQNTIVSQLNKYNSNATMFDQISIGVLMSIWMLTQIVFFFISLWCLRRKEEFKINSKVGEQETSQIS